MVASGASDRSDGIRKGGGSSNNGSNSKRDSERNEWLLLVAVDVIHAHIHNAAGS